MHWHSYNNTVLLSNAKKTGKFHYGIYHIIFKNSEFSTISSACHPAVRPGSASTVAPVFSHNKGNCRLFTKFK